MSFSVRGLVIASILCLYVNKAQCFCISAFSFAFMYDGEFKKLGYKDINRAHYISR